MKFLDSLKDVFRMCVCACDLSTAHQRGESWSSAALGPVVRAEKKKGICGFSVCVPQHAERRWLQAQSMGQIWTEKRRFSKSAFQRGGRALLHSAFVFHKDFAQCCTLTRISASVAFDCNHNNLCESQRSVPKTSVSHCQAADVHIEMMCV